MNSTDWKKLGFYQSINEHKVFVIDTDRITKLLATFYEQTHNDNPTMVFLHGYPTSTYDYHKVFVKLSMKNRVVMHDQLGFGFSDKPLDYSYSLLEQADMALSLWKLLGLKKVTLVAHDYGTSVATEILARDNANELEIEIEQLILCNGSIHIELSKLRTIQKLLKHKWLGKYVAKLTNYPIFKINMKKIYFDSSKVTDDELREMWKLIELNGGRKIIHKLTQYISERYQYWDRWVGAVTETQIPTKIIWAKNDPIAIPAIAELLATEIPNNELIWLENTGHFSMLENPEGWIDLILNEQ